MKLHRDPKLQALLAAPSSVLFLDIETTGLSHYYDQITLLGWSVGSSYEVALPWESTDRFRKALKHASALVTFNGTLFDLRFLRREFPDIAVPEFHVDLRYLAKRANLTGGQKRIEKILGINVRQGLEEVDGRVAVVLWHRYLRGDISALRRLIAYNRADVLAMRLIVDHLIEQLKIQPDLFVTSPRFSSNGARNIGYARNNAPLPHPKLQETRRTYKDLFQGTTAATTRSVGIDLTGSEKRPSGWSLLENGWASTKALHTDEQIVEETIAARPDIVSIDSPLSLPFGRLDVYDSDPTRLEFGIMRQCERELKRRGINVYPCLLPSMQNLTKRGIALASRFRKLGLPVIECYPGAAQDIVGIPRKGAGTDLLILGMAEFGISGPYEKATVTHDELDAITCALVGHFFLAGKFEALSGPNEGALIIPKLAAFDDCKVIGFSGRIAAGKTTASRLLEAHGYAYTRFSLVIDDEIVRRGLLPNRATRQQVGQQLHQEKGQRWLAEHAIQRVGDERLITIDGLRFPEDHAFFVEKYGPNFRHVHIVADRQVRRERYLATGDASATFDSADGNLVESKVGHLASLAHETICNSDSLESFSAAIQHLYAPAV